MKISTPFGTIDTNQIFDLSVEIGNPERFVKAWYVDDPVISPVTGDGFIGAVEQGSPVNFRNVFFNPHGHGTHTETFGHISKDIFSINKVDMPLFQRALLLSVTPIERKTSDSTDVVIDVGQFEPLIASQGLFEAVIIRTNWKGNRLNMDYSNQNPPFLERNIASLLKDRGVKHLLIDLPSVDKEKDDGALAFHHAFWNFPNQPDERRTITEFIHVPTFIPDGEYLLSLQVSPFENDAAPSRPLILPIIS
ncbi:unnamed protein product [Chrysoparadoxa australica]